MEAQNSKLAARERLKQYRNQRLTLHTLPLVSYNSSVCIQWSTQARAQPDWGPQPALAGESATAQENRFIGRCILRRINFQQRAAIPKEFFFKRTNRECL
jgi:hypothetical protein